MSAAREPQGNRLLGGLFHPGSLWPEAREFSRVVGTNPYAQEAHVQALAGLLAVTREMWEPNIGVSNDRLPSEEAEQSILNVIRFLRERFPEFASLEPFQLDRDFNLPDYPGCDPFTKEFIEERLLEGNFDKGGVE